MGQAKRAPSPLPGWMGCASLTPSYARKCMTRDLCIAVAICGLHAGLALAQEAPPPARTAADVIAASAPADWRPLDPENTLYVELDGGRVVIELAPAFAPQHVGNVKALAREAYFDGLAIMRAQDNYVVQWGDPDAEKETRRAIKHGKRTLPPEFAR